MTTVRKLEGVELHPKRIKGVWRFDVGEVEQLVAARAKSRATPDECAGSLAADAFALFERGADLRDCVKSLRVSPATVDALFREWSQPSLRRRSELRAQDDQAEHDKLLDEAYQRWIERQSANSK